jgi:hypothetical protein
VVAFSIELVGHADLDQTTVILDRKLRVVFQRLILAQNGVATRFGVGSRDPRILRWTIGHGLNSKI